MEHNSTAEIIAHRGASFEAPENTMEAFQLGLDQGADAIECDVHLSADDELVVIHDDHIERVTGQPDAVNELTLAELKALDAGSWKASEWKGARIPSLAEVMDAVPADRRIFIEIKVGLAALPALQKAFQATALPFSQMVLMEFDLPTVIAMKSAFPDAEILWLNDFPVLSFPWQKKRALKEIIQTTAAHELDGVNLQNISALNAGVINSCKTHNLSCYCWTVDDPGRAESLVRGQINGIATNRPGWMREQLNFNNPRSW